MHWYFAMSQAMLSILLGFVELDQVPEIVAEIG